MKKILHPAFFIAALLMFGGCCVPRFLCDPETGNVRYGGEISYRISNYVGEDVNEDSKPVGNPGLGLFFNWIPCDECPLFGLRSGLRFDGYGSRLDYSGDGIEDKAKDRLSYLTLPFTFNYEVANNFRVEAGPDVSFLLNAKQIQTYQGEKTTLNGTEYYSKAQVGLNIGVSYVHQSGVEFFAGYNRGLNKLRSSDYDQKIFNSSFNIGARYNINNLLSGK